MRNRYIIIRRKVLNFILNLIGIENIRGHLVYHRDLNENSVIVDLGANLGEFSVFMKSKFQCEPIALEANKFLCSEIQKKA